MKTDLKDLSDKDFASAFGIGIEELPPECRSIIASNDFRYHIVEGMDRDALILDAIKKIETDTQIIGAPERTDIWEKGWAENLRMFQESGYNRAALVPKFIRLNKAIRLNHQYAVPEDPMFELNYFSVLRTWLYKTYLTDIDAVYEFGSGTGFNLVALADLFPEKELHGLDFVSPSKDLINMIADVYHMNMQGHVFNMRLPDMDFKLKKNSAVMHLGAVEQLASDIDPFFEYLLKQKPSICIAMEPTIELYDESNLLDHLAAAFHRKRGYTQGYLPRLYELERQNKIKILKIKRTYFGSFFMEGFSVMIWKLL